MKDVKIAVFDWDVHQGDGTLEVLKQDANVLFISMHRYENGQFYPCYHRTDKGSLQESYEIGPNMLNIPVNKQIDFNLLKNRNKLTKMSQEIEDADYLYIFECIVYKMIK